MRTIDGDGEYSFLLTAIDGGINGGGGMDRFRIKIWEIAEGMVIFALGVASDLDTLHYLDI